MAWVKNELELAPPPPAPDTATWPPPPKARPPNPLDQTQTPPPTTPSPDQAQAATDPAKTEPEKTEPEKTEPEPAEDSKDPGKQGSVIAKAGTSKNGTPKTKSQTKTGETATPPAGTEPQPGKPKDLQGQLEKEPDTTLDVNPDGEAVVLDTKDPKKMKKAGIGLLTLYTVPRAAVYDGNTLLGTTPLVKVPLQAGTYRLRILDSESNSRLFSAPVVIAKDNKYTIRVSDLPMYPQ